MNHLHKVRVVVIVTFLSAAGLVSAQSPDTLYRSKGDHERTYKFTEAGVDSAYRLYVPESWDGKKQLPLVVILHGSRSTHDRVFEAEPADLKGVLKREADKHGFIIVAPEGYKDAEWGNHFPGALIQYLHPGQGAPRGAHRPDRPVGEEYEPRHPDALGPRKLPLARRVDAACAASPIWSDSLWVPPYLGKNTVPKRPRRTTYFLKMMYLTSSRLCRASMAPIPRDFTSWVIRLV